MSLSRILVFFAVVLSILGGIHYYLWTRLVRDPALPAPYFRAISWALVVLALAMPAAMILGRLVPRAAVQPLAWVSYVWMGVMFLLFVVLLGADVGRVAAWALRGAAPLDPGRRQVVARAISALAATLAGGTALAGMFAALGPTAVKRVRVPLAKFPRELSGYTIAQITDVHVGPTIGKGFIEQLVRKINALEPDMVAITGDLIDGPVAELGALVAPLRDLRARDGVYFVTGNHEYFADADEWVRYLATLGVRVLRNERVAIRGAGGFDLAGVDDLAGAGYGRGHGMDLAKALAGRDPSRAVVLLAHQPKAIRAAAPAGVDLQISGHTHGGQVFPFNFLVTLDQPYNAGLFTHDARTKIYVSRGTGYWGPPMRVGSPAEITRIELVSAEA